MMKLKCPDCWREIEVLNPEAWPPNEAIHCGCGATLWPKSDCAMTEDGWGPLFYYLSEDEDE
jgi:hypothetical protein